MFGDGGGDTMNVGLIRRQYDLPGKGVHGGGFDLLPRSLEAVRDGFLDFVIDQQPYLQGFYTVMEMFAFKASGGLVGPADINTGLKFVTKDSVEPYLTTKTRYEGSAEEAQIVPHSGPIGRSEPARRHGREPGLAAGDRRRAAFARRSMRFLLRPEASVIVVSVALVVYFELANQNFLTDANLQTMSQFVAAPVIIACGEIMLLICREIDLSVGQVFALAPFLMENAHDAGLPVPRRSWRRLPPAR